MKVINRTSHLIIAGNVMLVPEIPTECDYMKLKKRYPQLVKEEQDGKLQVVNDKQAEQALDELEQKTIKELKSYADKQGISLKNATAKADILNAIKAAGE